MTSPDSDDTGRRLIDLEVKAAFTEDFVERLNDIVIRQQRQIDLLIEELGRLRQQAAASEPPTLRGLREELPPHY